jgi:hypothetical protein
MQSTEIPEQCKVDYSVVCTDVNAYVDWQCAFQEHTWNEVGQSGELLRLITCPPSQQLPPSRHGHVIRIAEKSDRTGGYIAFERLFALQDWIKRDQPEGSVLILDPDCIFRAPVAEGAEPGKPRATLWLELPEQRGVQRATWPAIIHTRDLERLLPSWISFTRAIFSSTGRWESDMYGLVAAAASLGLRFSLEQISAFVRWPDSACRDAPIVHYAHDTYATDDRLIWSKRTYKPWNAVEGAELAKHDYCRDLLRILNQYAQKRRSTR